ncbi:hypothetical protein HWV62_10485 [Athelia sp. TMB]|nr:hypothetical protein HWV62_10485 [Athelia sp. TMB]
MRTRSRTVAQHAGPPQHPPPPPPPVKSKRPPAKPPTRKGKNKKVVKSPEIIESEDSEPPGDGAANPREDEPTPAGQLARDTAPLVADSLEQSLNTAVPARPTRIRPDKKIPALRYRAAPTPPPIATLAEPTSTSSAVPAVPSVAPSRAPLSRRYGRSQVAVESHVAPRRAETVIPETPAAHAPSSPLPSRYLATHRYRKMSGSPIPAEPVDESVLPGLRFSNANRSPTPFHSRSDDSLPEAPSPIDLLAIIAASSSSTKPRPRKVVTTVEDVQDEPQYEPSSEDGPQSPGAVQDEHTPGSPSAEYEPSPEDGPQYESLPEGGPQYEFPPKDGPQSSNVEDVFMAASDLAATSGGEMVETRLGTPPDYSEVASELIEGAEGGVHASEGQLTAPVPAITLPFDPWEPNNLMDVAGYAATFRHEAAMRAAGLHVSPTQAGSSGTHNEGTHSPSSPTPVPSTRGPTYDFQPNFYVDHGGQMADSWPEADGSEPLGGSPSAASPSLISHPTADGGGAPLLDSSTGPTRQQPTRTTRKPSIPVQHIPDETLAFETDKKAFIIESDVSDSDEYAPWKPPQSRSVTPSASTMDAPEDAGADEGNSKLTARRKAKGKQKACDDAETAPLAPVGRPTQEALKRVEDMSQKIQKDIAKLAQELGWTYSTTMLRLGLARQESRKTLLCNAWKAVEKHKRAEREEPEQWKPQDYNDGYKKWAADHGDDPDAAADLLAEHAALYASEDKRLTSTDIEKRVSRIGVQFAQMANNYKMTCNISVFGAVVHLGSEHASTLFAPSLEQKAALVRGFNLDESHFLLKAKSMLVLDEDEKIVQERDAPSALTQEQKDTIFWTMGKSKRDSWRRWVKQYLSDKIAELVPEHTAGWSGKKFPTLARNFELVLVGWGPRMPEIPNSGWDEKKGGQLQLGHWQELVYRIPSSWHNNKYRRDIPDTELDLGIVRLADFRRTHPHLADESPSVVDELGRILSTYDDESGALKGKGKAKAQSQPRGRSTVPRKPSGSNENRHQNRYSTPTASTRSASSGSRSRSRSSRRRYPSVHYVPTGVMSPSGNKTKRARVAASPSPTRSPPPPERRQHRPLPARVEHDLKRKRRTDDVIPGPATVLEPGTGNAQLQHPQGDFGAPVPAAGPQPLRFPSAQPPPATVGGPVAAANAHISPVFHPAYLPPPYPAQAPFPPHSGYNPGAYMAPYYPQPYPSQQMWPPAGNPRLQPQPMWSQRALSHPQEQLTDEEFTALRQMRASRPPPNHHT